MATVEAALPDDRKLHVTFTNYLCDLENIEWNWVSNVYSEFMAIVYGNFVCNRFSREYIFLILKFIHCECQEGNNQLITIVIKDKLQGNTGKCSQRARKITSTDMAIETRRK